MKILTLVETLQELAKALNKPCMYISVGDRASYEEMLGAAPCLDSWEHRQLLADGAGFIVFDDDLEMRRCYVTIAHADSWEEDAPFEWRVVTCDAEGCVNPLPFLEGYDGYGRCRSCGAFVGDSHVEGCATLEKGSNE